MEFQHVVSAKHKKKKFSEDQYIKMKRKFYFTKLPESVRNSLQMDKVAAYCVTEMGVADEISKRIVQECPHAKVITDGTACIGGNVFSFCEYFQIVNAIEWNANRFEMLQHNIQVLGLSGKVSLVCDDYTKCFKRFKQDVVFLDPPWGGQDYKQIKLLSIFVSGIPLADVCKSILKLEKTCMIALKLPKNFNIDEFHMQMPNATVEIGQKYLKMLLVFVKRPFDNSLTHDFSNMEVED